LGLSLSRLSLAIFCLYSSLVFADFTPYPGNSAPVSAGNYSEDHSFSGEFKAVSYNAAFGNQIPAVTKVFKKWVEKKYADIIIIQEIERTPGFGDQADYMAYEIGMNFVMIPSRNYDNKDHGQAVLSRFPIVDYAKYDIPVKQFPDNEPRIIVRVTLELAPGLLLTVYNLHFATITFPNSFKRKQMKFLKRVIERENPQGPIIVAGDLNSHMFFTQISNYQVMRTIGFSTQGFRLPSTYKVWGPIKFKTDWVFYRGLNSLDSWVVKKFPFSDHDPILQHFAIP
jgi:endonuclease/exonuclease/phosphatase family metal-dependent hydrolase